jgi:hypothetical protein
LARRYRQLETLHVSGSLAGQVAHALEDVPLCLKTTTGRWNPLVSLCQLNGRPVMIVDLETIKLEMLNAYRSLSLDSEKGS